MHGGAAFCRQWAQEWAGAFVDDNGENDGGGCHAEVVVCPPFAYIGALRAQLSAVGGAAKDVLIGAQDISRFDADGAYTGEVSARMAAECGCAYVIIGHSERRRLFGEDDAAVAAKLRAAIGAGLRPVLCIGESEGQKQQGKTAAVINEQLAAAAAIGDIGAQKLVIAYEPVWAIGSGQTPEAGDIAKVQKVIRQKLMSQSGAFGGRIPILYGGSVRADNVAVLLGDGDVDGVLVGGACLSAAGFAAITRMP